MNNIVLFLKEVRAELTKIIWPTPQDFVQSTIVALVVILLFTLYLSGINYIFYLGVQKAFRLMSLYI